TPTAIDPNAEITISRNGDPAFAVANGTASQDLDLNVGLNTIIVTVTDSAGDIQEYTVLIYRAQSIFIPIPQTSTITTDVVIGGDNEADIVKVDIQRTIGLDGVITDQVTYTPDKATESAEKAVQSGENIARIVIPDPEDVVSVVNVDIPRETLAILQDK